MSYPDGNLTTRAIVEHGKYALIPPQGRVNNNVPGFEDCNISIIASPELGASFAQYVTEVLPGGKTTEIFGGDGLETFIYTLEGKGKVTIEGQTEELTEGGYAYAPPTSGMEIKNESDDNWRVFMHKQAYEPLEGYSVRPVFGNSNDLEGEIYEDMENVFLKTFLPDEMGFDVNFYILTFETDGSHPFIETHMQEHGLYFLQGQGMYLLDDKWVPVEKEDYIWFGPYTPQAYYCTGRESTSYIYSKNCNRDVPLKK